MRSPLLKRHGVQRKIFLFAFLCKSLQRLRGFTYNLHSQLSLKKGPSFLRTDVFCTPNLPRTLDSREISLFPLRSSQSPSAFPCKIVFRPRLSAQALTKDLPQMLKGTDTSAAPVDRGPTVISSHQPLEPRVDASSRAPSFPWSRPYPLSPVHPR